MNKNSTLLSAIGFILLWNSGFIGAEFGLPYTGPFTLVFWRYLALTIVIAAFLMVRKKLRWVGWKRAGMNMLVGFLAHGVWLTCVLFALNNNVPAGIVALVVGLQPLTTGAFAWTVTGERTNHYQWMGLILGFIGVCVSVGFRIDFSDFQSIFSYLIPLGSVVGITVASLLQRKMDIERDAKKLPLDQTLFYQSFATTVALALPAMLMEGLKTQWHPVFIGTMIWLILAVSLGAYTLMWILIDRLEATRVASLFYLGPPVTMIMAWLAFGDTVTQTDFLGLGIVFLGVLLTQLNESKKKSVKAGFRMLKVLKQNRHSWH